MFYSYACEITPKYFIQELSLLFHNNSISVITEYVMAFLPVITRLTNRMLWLGDRELPSIIYQIYSAWLNILFQRLHFIGQFKTGPIFISHSLPTGDPALYL